MGMFLIHDYFLKIGITIILCVFVCVSPHIVLKPPSSKCHPKAVSPTHCYASKDLFNFIYG